jgi:hypothetical protein
VHGVAMHTAGVVARARARLAALVRRPRAAALQRLAGLMPGVAARIDLAGAAAYEEAAREAFRAATTLETASPLVPAPTAESPASTSGAARPVASVSARTAPAATPATEPAREPAPATPAAEPSSQPVTAERPARRSRRQAGETALDHLLRPPESVNSAANDFFDGLVGRVEGDR